MPEVAKILRFPTRVRATSASPDEARTAACAYLQASVPERRQALNDEYLQDSDVLLATCAALRQQVHDSPARVAQDASIIYEWITSHQTLGLFDERDYFAGEISLVAAVACRHLGNLQESERWLDRADAGFRHTVNPTPLMATVTYQRLALRYASGRGDEALELLPSLVASFQRLGMDSELVKCRFLEAMALKQRGQVDDALLRFEELLNAPAIEQDRALLGQTLVHVADCHTARNNFDGARVAYERALPIVAEGGRPFVVAELKWSLGNTYRAQGEMGKAVSAYRAATSAYLSLEMKVETALLHLVIAEVMLAMGKQREAEWEILAALPTIEEERMAPAGFAAVALLRESVRQRKTDPKALLELREYLQAKN